MKICPACERRFEAGVWSCPHCAWRAAAQGRVQVVTGSGAATGFSATFFRPLAEAEERHFWFRSRNALITWAIARYFPEARTALDVGCGNGQVSRALERALPGLRLTAADAFIEGLQIAAERVRTTELVQADVLHLPWEREFDVVGAFDVIEHVAEDEAALREMARAVRPGGGVIVTVPQHQWLWTAVDEHSGHVRRYSRAMLRSRLERAGLRVERMASFVSLLLPLLVLWRSARRISPDDPVAELAMPAAGNVAGAFVMGVERQLIRAGVPLPAGASLLAVARRSDA